MSTVAEPLTANHLAPAEPPAPVLSPSMSGDPSIIGLPIFVAGSLVLGLSLIGFVPAAAGGSAIPIILAGTGIGLTISAIWAAALGQTLVAGIFGLFAGFWLSYSTLVLGLNHDWFKIPATDVQDSVTMFQLTWAVVMAALTLATLRLPSAFTAVVGLVVLALVLLIFAGQNASAGLTHVAGIVVLAFASLGIYLFLSVASVATGGKGYPLGAPLVK